LHGMQRQDASRLAGAQYGTQIEGAALMRKP
jgi:hypothetical protein